MAEVTFHFHGELNDFLPPRWRGAEFAFAYNGPQSVKHLIEAAGVPHPEVALIVANGQPVGFEHQPADGSGIAVYPEHSGVAIEDAPALRPPLPEPVAFLTDNHLGRLTRTLRLLGFDTAYGGDAADDMLAERAHDENRVLLTRDRGLLKRSLVVFGYCPRSTDPRQQLFAVLRRYRLFDRVEAWRRCLRCNGLLRPVDKAAVLDRLEPKTKLYYDEFQQCGRCGQVYWRGSHFGELERLVVEVQSRRMNDDSYHLQPIGFIRSPLTDRLAAPNQGYEGAPDAWLEVDNALAAGLEGIAVGDEIIVVTWLHQSRRDVLRLHPQWNEANPLTGVFNTRSPDRPNPLGLHRVRVRAMAGNRLLVGPIEVINGTPVVDIKPTLPEVTDN